jgi:hypothetical protein
MDDLADSGDEGRGKQRYAPGSCKQTVIRRSPNGATHLGSTQIPWLESIELGSETERTETSQYLQENKSYEIPPVAASEKGKG